MTLSKVHIAVIAVVAIVVVAAAVILVTNGGGNDSGGGGTVDDYSSDPILWVRGNANGDQIIDKSDVSVINAVINAGGTTSKYAWCDANNDGKIDSNDVSFVQSMINGKATYLYFKNIDDNIVKYTIQDHHYVIAVNQCNAQELQVIINKDSQSKFVGGDQQIKKYNNVFNLNFGTDPAKGEVLVTGTSNGEVQAEVVSTLLKTYGHLDITLGSSSSYGKTLETDFKNEPNINIVRLPSWEDGTLSGVMTYGYLFGGVQKNSCWDQALKYYDLYTKYYDPIVKEVAKIKESDRPNVLVMYVKDCYPGATDKVLSKTSGDFERSVMCGGNNIGEYFGTGYVAVTKEDMAACQKTKGIDVIIVEPSYVYGDNGKQGVIDAVQLCIDEFDGYISPETEIYSLSFMVTTGPACVVSFVSFVQAFFPDNSVFKNYDANEVFEKYLELAGWSDRTDISDIVFYGPGHTTTKI